MKTFEQHRLKFQAKQPESVGKTKRILADNFFFPINACVHYQANSHQEIGMKGNNPLLHNWPKDDDIFLAHIEEGYGEVGKPKERNISSSLITNFFKGNARFTRARRIDRLLHRPRNLIIFDYSLMQHRFHYTQSLKQDYYEFINIAKAYETQINALASQRENFLVIQLPTDLPEKPDFMKVDKPEPDNDELVKFGSIGSYWLRELWLFCSGQGTLANINHPEKLNLLLADGRAFMSINLALFKERAENESNGQKSLIQILDTFAEARTAVETEALPELDESESDKGVIAKKAISNTPELVTTINDAVASGSMTPKEAERFVKLTESSYDLPSPTGNGTIAEDIVIAPEEYKVSEETASLANDKVSRPEMKKSRTTNIVKDYVNKSLEKDIVRGIMGIGSMGVAIKSIEKTEAMDAANDFVEYKVVTVLATGKQSTTRLRIPRVNEDGEFKANNVTYKMAFSKVDAPIRKTKYNQAALTSYYGKVFVSRSDRSADDRSAWVAKKLIAFSLDAEDTRVTKGRLGSNDVPGSVAVPTDYASIMRRMSVFTSGDKSFTFEYGKLPENFDDNIIKLATKKKLTLCGKSKTGSLAMGMDNVVYELTGNDVTPLGRMNEVIGGTWGREPIDTHFVHIYGKRIPLGLALGYYQGISGVLEKTGIKYREVSSNIRSTADENEFKIRFKDKTLYVDRRNPIASPVLSGFLATDISRYTMEEFEKKGVYTSVLMAMGLHTLAIRELKLVREGFVDPKTREILREMKEPENYLDLLYRCADLLKDDRTPKETDPRFMKLRGYERIGGFIYREFVDSIRRQRGLPNPSLGGIGMKPTAIWQTMVGDATTQLVQVVNPIHTLKEQEAVSLSGEGGRSAQSLVGRTRVFHKDDVGIFSESVPDSSKVGIRTFLTPNAAINSTLGTFGKYDKDSGAVGAFSTTSNVFPASNHDDKIFCRR